MISCYNMDAVDTDADTDAEAVDRVICLGNGY